MPEPLVLVPGHMCDGRLFAPQLVEFASLEPQVADVTQDDSIAGMASRVLAAAPPRFALLGLSMGGIVAFEILRRSPQRVTRLALLDTNPYPEAVHRTEERREWMREVTAGRLRPVIVERMKPAYLAACHRDDPVLLDLVVQMALDLGAEVFLRQSRALSTRPDSRPSLAAIRVPTLVLCGREDGLCSVDVHREIAAGIPGATLAIIEQAGHLPTLERPTETNARLRQWLDA